MQTEENSTATPAEKTTTVIKLDYPITSAGDKQVAEVTVRKPMSGALRNLAMTDLLRMQTEAIRTILPRITEPMLHKQDLDKLDPADFVQLGTAVVGFLVPKADREDFLPE